MFAKDRKHTKAQQPANASPKNRIYLFHENTDGLSAEKKRLFVLWNAVCLLGTSFLLCVMSLLLAYGPYASEIFWGYFQKPLILLLNLLPILLLQVLLYACVGRQWIAYLITAALIITASVCNYYKLRLRSDPVVFSDMFTMFTAVGFAGHYQFQIGIRVVLAVCSVPAGTLFLLYCACGRFQWKGRLLTALVVALSLYPLWSLVYAPKSVFQSPAMVNDKYIYQRSDTQQMVCRGFVYSFINSATKVYEQVPEGYSEAIVKQELAPYTDAAIPANKKVNLLAIQLEAFVDLEQLGITDIDPSAYAAYHAVKQDSYAGELITNIFAGGTIDTERCFVTGSSMLHYYGKNTPSYVWYLKEQGYKTTGNHPCTWEFYNRRNINAYLGFEEYFYTENHFGSISEGGSTNDDLLFPELKTHYAQAMAEGYVFDFTVTYQGHGPYDTQQLLSETVLWDGTGYSDTTYHVVNNYLSSVKNTGEHLLELTQWLSQSDEPVVLLVFGDHKPWMGNDASVYEELSVSFDLSTEQGVTNYYGTEYLIWANDAAKEKIGFDFRGQAPTTSSGYLMNILFNTLGWKGPAYMQYTETLRQILPVITSTGVIYNQDGLTYTLTPQEAEAFNRLQYVQYYRHRHFEQIT